MAGKKEKIARVQGLLEYVVSDLLRWSESGHICDIVFSVVFHKASSVIPEWDGHVRLRGAPATASLARQGPFPVPKSERIVQCLVRAPVVDPSSPHLVGYKRLQRSEDIHEPCFDQVIYHGRDVLV